MRLFQNAGLYPAYLPRLHSLCRDANTFSERIDRYLGDSYGACHVLQPVIRRLSESFITNADDELTQQLWAKEQGMPVASGPAEILLAQLEEHRSDVFYNMDPMRFGSELVRRLPACVKRSIAWRAAPSPGADFSAYDLVVCNFPSILDDYRRMGWKAAMFSPAHDPAMDFFSAVQDRPVDVLFVGGYSRHHRRRAELLEAVASLASEITVVMHLDCSRLTRIAESPLGRILPIARHRRPKVVTRVAKPAIFGRQLYQAIGSAKIVLNGAIDMAGSDRGNMRCFEAMGCGALLVSDQGAYPEGMVSGSTMVTYKDEREAVDLIRQCLADESYRHLAARGHQMVGTMYSKDRQWRDFQNLVGALA